MPRKRKVNFRETTRGDVPLASGTETALDFWPSGGHDVRVVGSRDGKSVSVCFDDRGWTNHNVSLVIQVTQDGKLGCILKR